MNIIEMAQQVGLQVLLDARIGNETYHSVSGSLATLQRFADAVDAATRAELRNEGAAKAIAKTASPHRAAAQRRRAHRRTLRIRTNTTPRPAAVMAARFAALTKKRTRASTDLRRLKPTRAQALHGALASGRAIRPRAMRARATPRRRALAARQECRGSAP